MSLHPSLKRGSNKSLSRTVIKREERIKKLIEEGKWNDERDVFGLPKMKIVRMKMAKKEEKQQDKGEKQGSQASKQKSKK